MWARSAIRHPPKDEQQALQPRGRHQVLLQQGEFLIISYLSLNLIIFHCVQCAGRINKKKNTEEAV